MLKQINHLLRILYYHKQENDMHYYTIPRIRNVSFTVLHILSHKFTFTKYPLLPHPKANNPDSRRDLIIASVFIRYNIVYNVNIICVF